MEDQVLSLIQKSGLPRIADDITALLRYGIRLKTRPVGDATVPPGASKLGWVPDLPPGIDWPEWDDRPLPLIAQIRLADIAPYDRSGELPQRGILSFFFNEDALDSYPLARGSWRVLYHEDAHLRPGVSSSEEQQVYPTCAVEFSTVLTLPPFESLFLERLGLSYTAFQRDASLEHRREADAYIHLTTQLDALYESTSPYHQLLGHPYQIQGDLLQECQRDTHAKGDPSDWRLLLQVDSDDDAQMMWGDVGVLYFYIPQQALIARDFSQVHLVMQCS